MVMMMKTLSIFLEVRLFIVIRLFLFTISQVIQGSK